MIEIDADYRNRVKENYQFSEWSGRTKLGDSNVRIRDFSVPSDIVKGLNLEAKEELLPSERQQQIMRYIYSSSRGAGDQRLVVTVFECNSVIEADETLIDVVMTYMAPKLPRCETKGLEIGDICFAGHGEVNLSVIFARFNILAEVRSASPSTTSV